MTRITWRLIAGVASRSASLRSDAGELLGQVLVLCLLALGANAGEGLLEGLLVAAKLTDALGDQLGSIPCSASALGFSGV